MKKINTQTLLRAYFGLVWIFIMTMDVQIVHGNPVKIKQSSGSLNVNGKAVVKDILRELGPEAEAPIFASFEFGLGDRSDHDQDRNERRSGWYNQGDYESNFFCIFKGNIP